MFAIRSSEVFALGGDLLYIFYGSCSGAFSKFAGERLFAHPRFAFRGSTVVLFQLHGGMVSRMQELGTHLSTVHNTKHLDPYL